MTDSERLISEYFGDAIVENYMGDDHANYFDVYEDDSGEPTHEAKIEHEDGSLSIRQAGLEDWEFAFYTRGER